LLSFLALVPEKKKNFLEEAQGFISRAHETLSALQIVIEKRQISPRIIKMVDQNSALWYFRINLLLAPLFSYSLD